MISSRRVVTGLVLLAIVHLAANVGLLAWAEYSKVTNRWGQLIMSLLLSEALLLACWTALGQVKWYWRLALAVPLTMLIGQSLGWANAFVDRKGAAPDDDGVSFATLMFLVVWLFGYAVLWPLGRLQGWTLSWRPLQTQSKPLRYHSGDVLYWMIPIGGVLASFRFLMSLTDNGSAGLADFLFTLLALSLLVAVSMVTAFSTRSVFLQILWLAAAGLLLGGPFIGFNMWERWLAVARVVPGRPWFHYARTSSLEAVPKIIPFATLALVTWVDFWALRALGCQLLRPGRNTAKGALHVKMLAPSQRRT